MSSSDSFELFGCPGFYYKKVVSDRRWSEDTYFYLHRAADGSKVTSIVVSESRTSPYRQESIPVETRIYGSLDGEDEVHAFGAMMEAVSEFVQQIHSRSPELELAHDRSLVSKRLRVVQIAAQRAAHEKYVSELKETVSWFLNETVKFRRRGRVSTVRAKLVRVTSSGKILTRTTDGHNVDIEPGDLTFLSWLDEGGKYVEIDIPEPPKNPG